MSTIRLVALRTVGIGLLTAVFSFLMLILMISDSALAARGGGRSSSSFSSGSDSYSSSGREMLFDLSGHYVRDTKPDGLTDTATRFSVGGMFTSWIGLDLQASYQVKSKNTLIGADLRIAPVDWFFLKGGVGGYSSKASRELQLTPLGGTGILARMTREVYLLTEASYFQVNGRDNVAFGAGIGLIF